MRLVTLSALLLALAIAGTGWAHGNQGRDFNAVLGPAPGLENGSGQIKFRQPKDEEWIAYLHVRLKDLLPHRSYYLERATDETLDGACTGQNWLRLGHGSSIPVVPIGTDEGGDGPALLFRDLTVAQGRTFDIYFRVKEATTDETVLVSDCNRFTALQ